MTAAVGSKSQTWQPFKIFNKPTAVLSHCLKAVGVQECLNLPLTRCCSWQQQAPVQRRALESAGSEPAVAPSAKCHTALKVFLSLDHSLSLQCAPSHTHLRTQHLIQTQTTAQTHHGATPLPSTLQSTPNQAYARVETPLTLCNCSQHPSYLQLMSDHSAEHTN